MAFNNPYFCRMKYALYLTLFIAFMSACQQQNRKQTSSNIALKNHSYSNFNEIKMKHLYWNTVINFESKTIEASAKWTFSQIKPTDAIRLDIYDLQIQNVTINGETRNFSLSSFDSTYGSALICALNKNDSIIEIKYTTGKLAKALQWLSPTQTLGKKMPYLFTQCESIAARSVIPCMDVPNNRITYTAEVQTPKGMLAIMSAENPTTKNENGKYSFVMNIPIPTYLFALAVGNIDYKKIDARCGVYSEPEQLEKCFNEFSELPNMISTAEKLAGKYFWERYDVLVQPPSFPIGGMENPKLTFATPTIVAGDKSLVSLIAHELAHSWSGNTVTNATWSDLWLNEGFTTYFEKRIMEALRGKDYVDMLWELSYQDMMADVADFGNESEDTKLKLNMENRDPDEAFTNIPYEKGAHFLWLIEQTVGRDNFDTFLTQYFTENKFKPMTTDSALLYFDKHLFSKNKEWKDKINVNKWVYGSGIPANCPRPNFVKFNAVDSLRSRFLSTNYTIQPADFAKWTTHEYLHFLRKMPRNINVKQIEILDKTFAFTQSNNSEITFEWLLLSIQTHYTVAYKKIELFLTNVGRRKFVKPMYKELLKGKNTNAEQQTLARQIFEQAKMNYHPSTYNSIMDIMK